MPQRESCDFHFPIPDNCLIVKEKLQGKNTVIRCYPTTCFILIPIYALIEKYGRLASVLSKTRWLSFLKIFFFYWFT